jgi:hypothetical protein
MQSLFELLIDGEVVSVHGSLQNAQQLANAVMPETPTLEIKRTDEIAAHRASHSQSWAYDYASAKWVEQ